MLVVEMLAHAELCDFMSVIYTTLQTEWRRSSRKV